MLMAVSLVPDRSCWPGPADAPGSRSEHLPSSAADLIAVTLTPAVPESGPDIGAAL